MNIRRSQSFSVTEVKKSRQVELKYDGNKLYQKSNKYQESLNYRSKRILNIHIIFLLQHKNNAS